MRKERTNMQKIWIAAALCANVAVAQNISQPVLQPQDTWTYRRTSETRPEVWRQVHFVGTVLRNSGNTVLLQNKEVDSPNPPREILIDSDWSNFRSLNGKETVVHRPFAFPMSVGKTWDLEFTDDHPGNKGHKSETRRLKYHVVGWEEVEVPAGKFKALKIEADGAWTGEIAPRTAASVVTQAGAQGTTAAAQTVNITAETVTGRLYQAYWYAPEVKREVKSVEENYDTSGVRSARFTNELESYKVAD
jgi:hypothetical protein